MSSLEVSICKKLKEFDLDVSFQAQSHSCIGILGASGCGKSMTLKMIAGIEDPDSGLVKGKEVYFDKEKRKNQKPQKRRIGYLFQNYALFPNMTVEQNILVGLKNRKKSKIEKSLEINELIRKFKLDGLEKQYPNQLSGGQQQRVALARIFAYQPEVLLLDEPFSAMDSHLKEELRRELIQLLKEYEGITILVTHNREEAFGLCDTLLIMDKGRIVRSGSTKEVFENPQNVVSARLTGCKNISRIEKIDERHVRALDFNQTIFEVKEMTQDYQYIGIRAHDLQESKQGELNAFCAGKCELSELPFEWSVVFENGICYKFAKDMHNHEAPRINDYFSVDPKKIMMLK